MIFKAEFSEVWNSYGIKLPENESRVKLNSCESRKYLILTSFRNTHCTHNTHTKN